ncbi:multidrug effflux MFS transporter [Corynebacterium pseudokroppenstedtii]|uniref:Multidrug effflux MFS transporter n=1 Tax=Corynebacterium pseudokroppenstedtii TaxID=2804917 RepID=A0AAU0PWX5_9CORY|nr:multidrug effflux MFS transporter [Corynebacterium pseudokroppenstedtii]MDU6478467.1 multidrug effflux MFS transporter [Corynebacterium kroppenstedtii]MBY0790257.1 multidrug effflux MFS transporter [Corynebacterium pseudokroppenstedtii]MCF6793204.1 multidrug effflux MFS transporter [Corynebacterium pseudokroppenstedtii]MCF8701996.1 multidrug effflux MFS transporter [Corynebacterium pseudokroppenstedtii]MCG2635856.1 multidrug effflux MFS transporter [Corynebacterium pseudokroppenstedtii]
MSTDPNSSSSNPSPSSSPDRGRSSSVGKVERVDVHSADPKSTGTSPKVPKKNQLTAAVLTSLALLSAAGPLGTDMYLPTFIDIAKDLSTTASSVQLTLSAFMIGLAVGQLFAGPISDGVGRRRPLVIGSLLFFLFSAGCALTPSIGLLIAFRLLQGIAGGTTVVVARSVIPDVAHGRAAASAFSALMAIQGLAPAIAPLLGGFLSPIIGWRGIFWVIAAFNVIMVVVSRFVVPESLPADHRTPGAIRNLLPTIFRCFGRPAFIGYCFAFAVGFGAFFSYISASPFVLQDQLGLPTHVYSITFAINSLAIAGMSALNGKLVNRFEVRSVLIFGLILYVATSAILLIDALLGPWLWPTLICLFVMTSATGLLLGNATALGVEAVRDIGAGAGSGAMGALQFLAAGIVSPLVGIGSDPSLSMALCMLVCSIIAIVGCVTLTSSSDRA